VLQRDSNEIEDAYKFTWHVVHLCETFNLLPSDLLLLFRCWSSKQALLLLVVQWNQKGGYISIQFFVFLRCTVVWRVLPLSWRLSFLSKPDYLKRGLQRLLYRLSTVESKGWDLLAWRGRFLFKKSCSWGLLACALLSTRTLICLWLFHYYIYFKSAVAGIICAISSTKSLKI